VAASWLSSCRSDHRRRGARAPFPVSFEYVGQTLGSKDVEVRARVTGIVEKRLFQEGSWVKAGQTLFVIDPKPYAAQVAQADADLARAQAQKAQGGSRSRAPASARRAQGDRQKERTTAASQRRTRVRAGQVRASQARRAELNWGYTRVVAPITA
jgi:membrane fusion protein (multidrug efflux system)